jgi:hypothetical protein
MSLKPSVLDKALKRFRAKKIMTLDLLAAVLQRSRRTAQRRLVEWQAINSYNKNGAYYTLPEVPTFNANGLWHYRDVFFSKYGNLTQTLIALVTNSKVGLNAAEMEELLGLQARSFLSLFRNHPDLRRDKSQGCYVYFSSDQAIYARQQRQRLTMIQSAKLPCDSEAIAILVETIKHPEMAIEDLCVELRKRKYKIFPETVRNLFAYHGLIVKKTPLSPS